MQLGFVSAILPDMPFEDVVGFAAAEGFSCIEVMCWPKGKAERRYAGVTHIDVDRFTKRDAERIGHLLDAKGVSISGLGYYPNPLAPDRAEARVYISHIKKVIRAAELLGVGVMNTFVGRDQTKTIEANWPAFKRVWKPLVAYAEDHNVKLGIENCPMLFSADEWPGGKNLAISPAVWRGMFEEIPSPNFGLNFDPSHLVWQYIDPVRAIHEFGDRFVHVHAKDMKICPQTVHQVGVTGFNWNIPKLPGLGDVDWSKFFSALTDVGYDGSVAIEVEDRSYEGSLEARKQALRQSKRYLEQFQF